MTTGKGQAWCVICESPIKISQTVVGYGNGAGTGADGRFAHEHCYKLETEQRPMQPIVKDDRGVVRFKQNKIVRTLLTLSTDRGVDLNTLAGIGDQFTQADWEQFYQLIGYSLAGYHELGEVSDATALMATEAARKVFPEMGHVGGCRDEGCNWHTGVKRRP